MQNEAGTFLSTANGAKIFWQVWLPGTAVKAVVVLAHGYGEHCDRYGHVGEALAGAGYALYALDHHGHGRSDGGRGQLPGFDCYLNDFGALIEMAQSAHPGVKTFIYGHSMGGCIALNYALTRPENLAGVIATGSLLKFGVEPPALKTAFVKLLDKVVPNLTLSGDIDTSTICRDEAVVEAYVNDPLVHDQLSMRLGKEMMSRAAYALDHAGDLAIPALLMHGGADRLTSPLGTRLFVERVKHDDVTHIEYEGLYHEIHNEPEQEKVIADIIAWLYVRA